MLGESRKRHQLRAVEEEQQIYLWQTTALCAPPYCSFSASILSFLHSCSGDSTVHVYFCRLFLLFQSCFYVLNLAPVLYCLCCIIHWFHYAVVCISLAFSPACFLTSNLHTRVSSSVNCFTLLPYIDRLSLILFSFIVFACVIS